MADHLLERSDGFAYDYRMQCECGDIVDVTAETYYREQFIEALVPCGHCGEMVHFGPRVALLRDLHDPALDNAAVPGLAWYHSSTWPDWPSADFTDLAAAQARETAKHFMLDADRMVELATTKALHLGTYEAAIENMLRRMRDQADRAKSFYLYRVQLHLDPARIEASYRDENTEDAAQLTVAELDAADFDAVRYLNTHEATGSLSLVIRPSCITAVQQLAIPVPDLADPPTAELLGRLEEVDRELDERDARDVAQGRTDRAVGRQMQSRNLAPYEHLSVLTAHYLRDISPVVADDLARSIDREPSGFVQRFAELAALFIRPNDVVERVAEQQWRRVAGGG